MWYPCSIFANRLDYSNLSKNKITLLQDSVFSPLKGLALVWVLVLHFTKSVDCTLLKTAFCRTIFWRHFHHHCSRQLSAFSTCMNRLWNLKCFLTQHLIATGLLRLIVFPFSQTDFSQKCRTQVFCLIIIDNEIFCPWFNSLQYSDISNNRLTSLPTDAFKSTTSLHSLSGNKILYFRFLNRYFRYLRNNNLTNLSERIFDGLDQLQIM